MPRSNARPVSVPLPTLRLMLSAALDGKRVPKYMEAYLECLRVAKPVYKLDGIERDAVCSFLSKNGADAKEIDGIFVAQISAKEIARFVANGHKSHAMGHIAKCEEVGLMVKVFNGCKGHSSIYALTPLPESLCIGATDCEGEAAPKANEIGAVNNDKSAAPKANEIGATFSGLGATFSGLGATDCEGEAALSNNQTINTQESNSPSASAPAITGAGRPLCMKCHRVMRYVELYGDYRCGYCQETLAYQKKKAAEAADDELLPAW